MHSIKRLLLLLICIISGLNALAQYVNYGTDPARFKWNIVHTDHYKLIYPIGNDSMAYRYAQLLETSYPYVQQTIGESRKWKFPVVLHPANMLSNGMVAWAPRRMELITTPSADNFAQPWDSHLVLHEGRHTFQTRKFMHGIFRPLYFAFGEQVSGLSNLAVPTWFLEGDAVATETALSNTGRGRLPEFSMIYRAQMESGKFYSFDKWFLGSYKNYTGTKYAMGYNMTAYARKEYGADIWDKVTTRYVKRILSIPPFSNAMEHYMKIGKQELFDNTFDFLQKEWKQMDDAHFQSGFTPNYLTTDEKQYTVYKYPQAIDDSTVIALKSNMSELNSLVSIRNGKVERLSYMGSVNSKLIYNNGRIFWTENVSGLRWTHENHSVLKYYDINSKRITTVTPQQRFQSPAINREGNVAAVSEFSIAGTNSVIFIDIETGNRLKSFFTPENTFVKDITFGDDNQVFITSIADDGITIWTLDIQNSQWEILLPPTWANINATFWHNGQLYFESGLNGTNNIYSIDSQTKKTKRITTSRFGAFTPTLSADGQQLLFTDYGKNGYRVASVSINSLTTETADFNKPYKFPLAETISKQENINFDTVRLAEVDFRPKRYNRALNLIKIHSWAPVYFDVSDIINMDVDDFSTIVKPGAMVLSQNSLNTAVAQAGWYYRKGDHYGKLAFTYSGWYPVIDLDMTVGGSAFNLEWQQNEEKEEVLRYNLPGRTRFESEARIYIPFNLSRGYYTSGIQPALTWYYTNNRIQQLGKEELSNFQYLMPELRFYKYRRMATRDILPRLGYQLRLSYLTPINTGNILSELYAARFTGYLPGIGSNHSLMLRIGYQYQPMKNSFMYMPKQILDEPRGYYYNSATKHLWATKADYAFTIAYPDWSIGSLAYIKRLRSNVFFDLSANKAAGKDDKWNTQSSAGIDLLVDWHGLQTEFPLSVGARFIKPFEKNGIQCEMLFSVSF